MDFINDAADIGVKSLGFIGDGEPTCNPNVWEALELGRRRELDLAISTNGVLVDSLFKQDAILQNCTWMRFCFSAGTKEGYKKIHGKDCYDTVVANIKALVERKRQLDFACEIGLQAVYVPGMMDDEMIAEAKLAVDLGVDYFLIKQCSLPDTPDGDSGMVSFDVRQYDDPKTIAVMDMCESMSTPDTDIVAKKILMRQKGERPYEHCPSISLISEMSGNGDWYPCGFQFGGKPEWEDYKLGNIQEKRFVDIFNSERYWNIVERMENDFNSHTMCKGCCRQDKTHEFCHNYRELSTWGKERLRELNGTLKTGSKPQGINFI
jgi:MoaA/NifB/PqqE/SkfB family radical SAM enzyme